MSPPSPARRPSGAAEWIVLSRGPAATRRLGRRLGEVLREEDVVALEGPLGAGKTELVRGIAAGLGIADARDVCSPSFQILRPYPTARMMIYHVDAYRLEEGDAILEQGLLEPVQGRGVWLVEWAGRIESLLGEDRLTIRIEVRGRLTRRITLRPRGSSWRGRRLPGRREAASAAGGFPAAGSRTIHGARRQDPR